MRQLIVSADDFGLSEEVNDAVEIAHRQGMLSTASLMVAGPAAADAVRRAQALPNLRVGLHLVVIEGPSVLSGPIGSDQLRLGIDYFFASGARRRLAAEVRAQYREFAATGLRLDHANAHKHMHLHPTVGKFLVEIGREFGLQALRIPAEPPRIMRACGASQGLGAQALHTWCGLLRRRGARAGLRMNDHMFGLAWSGHMLKPHLLRLAPLLPAGLSEIYFHPATSKDATLTRLMPDYEHAGELATLLDDEVRAALDRVATRSVWLSPRSG